MDHTFSTNIIPPPIADPCRKVYSRMSLYYMPCLLNCCNCIGCNITLILIKKKFPVLYIFTSELITYYKHQFIGVRTEGPGRPWFPLRVVPYLLSLSSARKIKVRLTFFCFYSHIHLMQVQEKNNVLFYEFHFHNCIRLRYNCLRKKVRLQSPPRVEAPQSGHYISTSPSNLPLILIDLGWPTLSQICACLWNSSFTCWGVEDW